MLYFLHTQLKQVKNNYVSASKSLSPIPFHQTAMFHPHKNTCVCPALHVISEPCMRLCVCVCVCVLYWHGCLFVTQHLQKWVALTRWHISSCELFPTLPSTTRILTVAIHLTILYISSVLLMTVTTHGRVSSLGSPSPLSGIGVLIRSAWYIKGLFRNHYLGWRLLGAPRFH